MDVKKAHAWGYYLIDEMHGWVLGFLEGDSDYFCLSTLIIRFHNVTWSFCDLGRVYIFFQVWLGWMLSCNIGLAFLHWLTFHTHLQTDKKQKRNKKLVLGLSFKRFLPFICSLRDSFEDELRAFQGGKDGLIPTIWEDEISNFPQVIIIFFLHVFNFNCFFLFFFSEMNKLKRLKRTYPQSMSFLFNT